MHNYVINMKSGCQISCEFTVSGLIKYWRRNKKVIRNVNDVLMNLWFDDLKSYINWMEV